MASLPPRRAIGAIFRHARIPKNTARQVVTSRSSSSMATTQSWSDEWKAAGLGARLPKPGTKMTNLLFVETGFGVDQHGDRSESGATKAAVRAVRNAIEFNSIPGVMEAVPGGRDEMLISVKLGVPPRTMESTSDNDGVEPVMPMEVRLDEVAKVFPYGRLMPMEVVVGGLAFHTGRIVRELGDRDDVAVCVAACISIGYDSGGSGGNIDSAESGVSNHSDHKIHDTRDGD